MINNFYSYLTVANAGVAVSVGCKDTPQRRNAHLVLKGAVLRH